MKFETKQNDSFSSVLFSVQIPLIKRNFRIHWMLYKSPDTWVTGYTSRTQNNQHVLFFDFDDINLDVLKEEIKFLQKKYKLSDFYIWEMDRPNAYHAVCLDTFCLQDAYEILSRSGADQSFINAPRNLPFREWTLRIGKKGNRNPPKYLCLVHGNKYLHLRSLGHANFLKKLGVPIQNKNIGKWDGYKMPTIVSYNTANRVRKE